MKHIIGHLKAAMPAMNPAEKAVAEYILEDPVSASSQSIHELAANAYVSTSAVIRMCRVLNFSGYRQFRQNLLLDIAESRKEQLSQDEQELIRGDTVEDIIHKITVKNIEFLRGTEDMINPETVAKCVSLMEKADRMILLGLGASYVAARDFYQKMLRLNRTCIINEDWHLQLLSARNSSPRDLGIIISYSGQTQEIISCMKDMKKNHTPMIAITREVRTPVHTLADYCLPVMANEALFRTAAMGSRISQLNVIDILYTAYASRNYDESLQLLQKTHIYKPAK